MSFSFLYGAWLTDRPGLQIAQPFLLPGIGAFTVLDEAVVTEADLGVNFFLEEESLGKSRAEEACRCLQELNPDVGGHFRNSVRKH